MSGGFLPLGITDAATSIIGGAVGNLIPEANGGKTWWVIPSYDDQEHPSEKEKKYFDHIQLEFAEPKLKTVAFDGKSNLPGQQYHVWKDDEGAVHREWRDKPVVNTLATEMNKVMDKAASRAFGFIPPEPKSWR